MVPEEPPSDAPDADLLSAFRAGDAGAFERLVERYEGALLRHLCLLTGRRAAAEDATQEAFLTLARRPPDPSDPRVAELGLGPWLHRVARNHALDHMRTQARRRDREAALTGERPPLAPDTSLAAVDAADTRALVERTLLALPEDQREVISLRLLEERSYQEIAEITGKKVGTVGWLISRGMRALARELGPLMEA
ncbi:MAG: RNA polymerase sigma factor [Planctomycetota bacterium]